MGQTGKKGPVAFHNCPSEGGGRQPQKFQCWEAPRDVRQCAHRLTSSMSKRVSPITITCLHPGPDGFGGVTAGSPGGSTYPALPTDSDVGSTPAFHTLAGCQTGPK